MIKIDSDITKAKTLSGDFYCSEEIFQLSKKKIFENSWQFICSKDEIGEQNSVFPFYFLNNYISEPLFLINNNQKISCFSNVCTHRGNILFESKTSITKN